MQSAASELKIYQMQDIRTHVLLVLFLQVLALTIYYFGALLKPLFRIITVLAPILLGAALVLNIFSLSILHMESFAELAPWLKYISAAIGLFISYTLFKIIMENRKFAMVAVIISLGLSIGLTINTPRNTTNDDSNAITPLGKASKNARNIYFISFDSMIPASLAKKFLDINSPPYIDTLKKHNATFFKNGFAAYVPTKNAMNSLLTIDSKNYIETPRDIRLHYFSGQQKSIVLDFLRKNGYLIQTIFKDAYFGTKMGPHIDFYYNGGLGLDSVNACDHVNQGVFLGYCDAKIAKLLPTANVEAIEAIDNNKKFNRHITPVLGRIKVAAESNRPWFTMAHIYSPGHTPKTFKHDNPKDLEKYISKFEDRTKRFTNDYLEQVLSLISEKDPTSIILITGDHGTYISRGLSPKTINDPEKKSQVQKFVIQDKHGINIAVWLKQNCDAHFEDLYKYEITFNLDVAKRVLECATGKELLSDKPLAVENLDHFQSVSYTHLTLPTTPYV